MQKQQSISLFQDKWIILVNFSNYYVNPKELSSFINPLKKVVTSKILCINSLFRKNYYNQRSTDFIIDLQEPLKNVTSLTLTNTDIPNNMYSAFDEFNSKIPETYLFHSTQISLPCGWWLSIDDIRYISKRVKEILKKIKS